MNNQGGALAFDATINDNNFQSHIDQMKRDIRGLSSTTQTETSRMNDSFSTLAKYAAGFFSINVAQQFVRQLVNVRGEFQQLEIAFGTMLQSKEKADALMKELIHTAAITPFNLSDVANGAKQLLAYGVAAKDVNDTLTRLGDIASGLSIPLGDLVYLYGTTRVQGRLYTQDVRQFMGRGIPLVQELAKQMGKTTQEINDMVTAGKVGFPEVQKVIESMTNEGGQFFNLMEKQSKSLTGQISNLGDSFDQMLNKIGQSNEGILSSGISGLATLVENYETVGKVIAGLVGTYGAYKAAVIAVNTVEKINTEITALKVASNGVYNTELALREILLGKVAAAQATLNAVEAINPYVFVATAVAGLTLAMWALHDSTTAEQKAVEAVNDEMEKFKGHIDDIKSKTQQLTGVIRSNVSTQFQQVEAYKQLQALYPELLRNKSLEQFITESATKTQKEFNGATDQMTMQHAIDEYNNAINKIKGYRKEIEEVKSGERKAWGDGSLFIEKHNDLIRQAQKEAQIYRAEVDRMKDSEWEANTPVEEKVKVYQKTIESLKNQRIEMERNLQQAKKVNGAFVNWQDTINSLTFDKLGEKILAMQKQVSEWLKKPAGNTGTLSDLEKQLKDARETQKGAATRGEFENYQKSIDAIQKKIDAITGGAKKAKGAIEKIFPAGSVAEYDRQIRKLQDDLSKINPETHPEQVVKLQGQIQDLTKQRIEAVKKIEIQSFQEQIDEKKKQYQDYEAWVLKFGKEIADAQFQDLLKSGTSYVDFLQKKLDKINATPKNKQQGDNAVLLANELNTATGQKSAIDKFSDDLDKLKRKSASIPEYINYLKTQEEALIGQTSELAIQKINLLKQKIAEANGDLVEMLRQFLQQVGNYETQSAAISAHYSALKKTISQSDLKDKKAALDEANQAEKEANERLINAQIDKKNKLEGLYKEIVGTGRDALQKQLENDQKALDNAIKIAGGDLNNDKVIRFKNLVEQDKRALSDFDISKWQDWATLVGQAGGELSQLPGALGQIGQVMQTLTQGAQQLGAAIKKANDGTATTGDAIAAGASAVATWVNIIASSIKQRKTAEEDYYTSVISYQNSYNLALIEQIGLQSQIQSNIFSEDYLSEIKDKWNESTAALDAYYDAIKKLDEGQVKTGTKKVADWGKVASGAVSGAALGASVSGPFAAIGAAIGGVVGGAIGYFGGKKTVDTFGKLLDEYPDLLNAQHELNMAQAQSLLDNGLLDAKTQEILSNAVKLQQAYEDAKKAIDDIIQGLVGDLGNQLRDALVTAFEDGTDAAQGFADAVENVLSNALSNIIFGAVFDQAFKELTARLKESSTTGDGNWIDDFGDFFSQYPELVKQFNEGMKSAQDQAKQYGLDLFGDSSKSNPNSLEGAIKSVSENTASVIAGQMNAIRINQAESLTIVRTQLLRLTTIADNSRYLMYLMSIDKRLAKAAGDPWRAQGVA